MKEGKGPDQTSERSDLSSDAQFRKPSLSIRLKPPSESRHFSLTRTASQSRPVAIRRAFFAAVNISQSTSVVPGGGKSWRGDTRPVLHIHQKPRAADYESAPSAASLHYLQKN